MAIFTLFPSLFSPARRKPPVQHAWPGLLSALCRHPEF